MGWKGKKTSEGKRNKEKQWKNILPTRAGQVMAAYRKNRSVVKLLCYWVNLLLERQIFMLLDSSYKIHTSAIVYSSVLREKVIHT